MPFFVYKAKKGPTEIVEGEIDAENEDAAIGKISALGLIPVKVASAESAPGPAPKKNPVEADEPAPAVTPKEAKITSGREKIRVPHKELNVFTRQFAILMNASVPLLRIFGILEAQAKSPKFKRILEDIQESLRQGAVLSECLGQYKRIFSQLYVSMVSSGEVSGTLDKVLMRLAIFAEKDAELRGRVRNALVYPLFLLLMGIATVFILLTFVMPKMMELFDDLGTELPTITQVVIKASQFCQAYWPIIIGVVAAGVVLFRTRGLSQKQKKSLDRLALKLPLIGMIVEKAESARFLRSMELLYDNGIPLYKAVEVSTRTVGNLIMREELKKVPALLEGGSTFAKSLEEVEYISPFVTNMVEVGEESGQLGSAVRETASFYEQETDEVIKMATTLLEPMMILGIGVIVGFLVVAMLLPIFEIHVVAQ